MVKEHERINDEFAALLTKVNVKSEVSATSLGMQTELARDLATLGLLSGSSFDKKYVHQQTMFENHFIELLDSSLIPSAKNPEIKTYLQKIRAEHEKFLAQDLPKSRSLRRSYPDVSRRVAVSGVDFPGLRIGFIFSVSDGSP